VKYAGGCLTVLIFIAMCVYALLKLNESPPIRVVPNPHVPKTEPPPPKIDPEKYVYVRSLNEYHKEETPKTHKVSYGFMDYRGNTQRIHCEIGIADHKNEFESFGYNDEAINKAVDYYLQKDVDKEIAKTGLTGYMTVKFSGGGGYEWSYEIPGTLGFDEIAKKKTKALEIVQRIETVYPGKQEKLEARLYQQRGFLLKKNELHFDYVGIIRRAEEPLKNCMEALKEASKDYGIRQKIGLYLSFFQEIRYVVPPDNVEGRKIIGLWVPTEVIVNNHGDCDSKSLALAAMYTRLGIPVIVVRVPGHVLLGVQGTPGADQAFVQIKNQYFILCEPAGPAKLEPGYEGTKNVSGNFEYFLIEPSTDTRI